jgi:hypothetical protein
LYRVLAWHVSAMNKISWYLVLLLLLCIGREEKRKEVKNNKLNKLKKRRGSHPSLTSVVPTFGQTHPQNRGWKSLPHLGTETKRSEKEERRERRERRRDERRGKERGGRGRGRGRKRREEGGRGGRGSGWLRSGRDIYI